MRVLASEGEGEGEGRGRGRTGTASLSSASARHGPRASVAVVLRAPPPTPRVLMCFASLNHLTRYLPPLRSAPSLTPC